MQNSLGRRVFLYVFVGIPLLALTVLIVSGLPYVLSVVHSGRYTAAGPMVIESGAFWPPQDSYWLNLRELPADGGVLDREHCDRPCFLGIIPGKAPLEHLLSLNEQYNLGCEEQDSTGTTMHCATDLWQVDFEVDENTQAILNARITYANLTLGEIVNKLGIPSWLYMETTANNLPPSKNILFFDDSLLAAWLQDPHETGTPAGEYWYRIAEDSQVDRVELIPATQYPHCCNLNWDAFFLPWDGYGNYTLAGNESNDF